MWDLFVLNPHLNFSQRSCTTMMQAETMKLASKHAEERAALQAALQARDADFTAVQRAAEEADAARAALERQGRELQVCYSQA